MSTVLQATSFGWCESSAKFQFLPSKQAQVGTVYSIAFAYVLSVHQVLLIQIQFSYCSYMEIAYGMMGIVMVVNKLDHLYWIKMCLCTSVLQYVFFM